MPDRSDVPHDNQPANPPPTQSGGHATPLPAPRGGGAVPPVKPSRPRAVLAHLRARLWLYLTWYLLACLAAAGFWAQDRGGGPAAFATAFAYLVACSAAFTLPGPLVERLASALGLTLERQRIVLLAILIAAAGVVAGTLTTSALWGTPPFILLCGNAIWAIDTLDGRIEAESRATRNDPRAG